MITKYSARRIDVIFDHYLYPSIKDSERCLRHAASLIDYKISGPEQPYNAKKSNDVDDGRFQLFVNNYKASDINENFRKKNQIFDASSIPPCKSELYQQLLRAHYISSLWINAHKKQPTNLDPLEYGWIEQDNTYAFKRFEGDQLPSFVSDSITNVPESDSIDDEDESSNDEHDSDDE
ncbi:hypothetical protein JTB14_033599 [Gonioctena quinquepunctata]|nr:hypothetical protein JTB14_033599 [Gonioctena quinquepunctata]